jgi:hypothetical protein
MKPTKTISISISHEVIRSFMAEFLAFAFHMQQSIDDQSVLSYLNNCPVSKEMVGTAVLTVIENAAQMGCIDDSDLLEIVKNLQSSVKQKDVPAGPRQPMVLM